MNAHRPKDISNIIFYFSSGNTVYDPHYGQRAYFIFRASLNKSNASFDL